MEGGHNHHAEGDQNKAVETTDRGMFDFMKKKDKDVATVDAHKQHTAKEEEKPTLWEKLHRSDSNSSSCSDEEEIGEDGEKKNKKGLKEKIKEKITGDKEATEHNEPSIPNESPEKDKGFLDKINEKLPGQHKKAEDGAHDGHSPAVGEPKEKCQGATDTRPRRIRPRII